MSKAKQDGQKPAKKLGRPTHFNAKLANRMLELAREGKTDAQIAEAVGISVATISNWKSNNATFVEALNGAKSVADQLVVASLFQRAVGYSHPAVKFVSTRDGIETLNYMEHYPPDVTACIFWLKNRQSKKWRDVHKEDQPTGQVTVMLGYDPTKKGQEHGRIEKTARPAIEAERVGESDAD